MRRTVLAAVGCFAVVATATGSLTANAALTKATSAPPCTPKVTTKDGRPIVYECGPATATLHVACKSYSYRNGFCQQSKLGGGALQLGLGTLAAARKGNAGQPYLSLSSTKIGGTVDAYYRGKLIANNLVVIGGRPPAQGTFKAKYGGAGFGAAFKGSWNCHGVIWQAP